MRIVFLIASSGGYKYQAISVGQSLTWLKRRPNNVLVYRVVGNGKLGKGAPTRFALHNPQNYGSAPMSGFNMIQSNRKNKLIVDSNTGWDQILTNSISAFDWVDRNIDYDFVIRTNVSTYWNISVLTDLLEKVEDPLFLRW
jgi:hypothetical protein